MKFNNNKKIKIKNKYNHKTTTESNPNIRLSLLTEHNM